MKVYFIQIRKNNKQENIFVVKTFEEAKELLFKIEHAGVHGMIVEEELTKILGRSVYHRLDKLKGKPEKQHFPRIQELKQPIK